MATGRTTGGKRSKRPGAALRKHAIHGYHDTGDAHPDNATTTKALNDENDGLGCPPAKQLKSQHHFFIIIFLKASFFFAYFSHSAQQA